MPVPVPQRLISRRARTIAACALLVAVVALVAYSRPDSPTARAGQTTTSARGLATAAGLPAVVTVRGGDPAATTTPDPPSGLAVMHASYRFADVSAVHPGAPALDGDAGILIDAGAHSILWEHDPHSPHAPASTTKILTALVALENLDPQRRVTATADALDQGGDETRLGIQAGETYSVTELVQAMMLVSANDAAKVLAVDTVGMPAFLRAMNEQVAALGLTDSHFTNPVGLDDPGEQASAYDLAVLGLAAYDSSSLFRQTVGTVDLDVPATEGHNAYHLHTIDRLLEIYAGAARGIKPGYTGDAGYCLVMLAERGGHRLVGVIMGAQNHIYEPGRQLLEWGFGQLGLAPLATPTPVPGRH